MPLSMVHSIKSKKEELSTEVVPLLLTACQLLSTGDFNCLEKNMTPKIRSCCKVFASCMKCQGLSGVFWCPHRRRERVFYTLF